MSQRIEGKIKKILIENEKLHFQIEYMEDEKNKLVKSITYSRRYSNHNYNKNDIVEIELLEDNKAKIINDNLVELETNYASPILVITSFLVVIFLWGANLVTENIIFSYIGQFIFIIIMGMLIWSFINAYNTDKKGIDVKGKVISKKAILGLKYNSRTEKSEDYSELYFKAIYDDKVYEIKGGESINVGDEVAITLYKNRAVLTKNKGINYKAIPILVLFISAIAYLIAFYEKIETSLIYIVPFFILLIIMFIYIAFVTNDKKGKKKRKVKE